MQGAEGECVRATCRVDAAVLCGLERGGLLDAYAEGGRETLLALCA